MQFCPACSNRLKNIEGHLVCAYCKNEVKNSSHPNPTKYDVQDVAHSSTLPQCFPKNLVPRDSQSKILIDIEEAIKSGYKHIVICAPTGIGKSAIATALASYFGSSFIITSTKKLQDQYTNDFGFFPVKGKSNFACFKLMKNANIDLTEVKFAIKNGLTCNLGKCVEKIIKKGRETEEICPFKPSLESFDLSDATGMCPYYVQKYNGLKTSHSVWNYAAYFQLIKFTKKIYQNYIDRKIVIFDEAHKIEDEIINFIGMDIYRSYLEEAHLNPDHYDLSESKMVVMLLEQLEEDCHKRIKDLEGTIDKDQEIQKLENRADKIHAILVDYLEEPENFVIDRSFEESNIFFSIKPLRISKYAKLFFSNSFQVYMSATINKASFCQNLGLDTSHVAFVEVEKSPFSLESRKVIFEDIAALGNSSSVDDEKNVLRRIDEILSEYPYKRGLILTSSKKKCYQIFDSLSVDNKKRIIIAHSDNIDESLKNHRKSLNSILLSSSLWEGVDLKGDLSEFQIIAKTPYPNLGEKRVQRKKENNPLWFSSVTIMKLLQGFGRSVRDFDDKAITHVLDSRAKILLQDNRHLVPKSFRDLF